MSEKAARGRPRVAEPLSKVRGVRFTEQEYSLVLAAAAAAGVSPAQWIRAAAVDEAQKRRKAPPSTDAEEGA